LKSYRPSLWDGTEKLTVREAITNEAQALSEALKIAEPDGDLLLALPGGTRRSRSVNLVLFSIVWPLGRRCAELAGIDVDHEKLRMNQSL
jgi:hypothetical protein